MTKRVTRTELIALVDGDTELIELLVNSEVISEADDFAAIDVDRLLVARTLIRELEVNVAGVDIILRLRQELAEARCRLRESSQGGAETGGAPGDTES